MPKPLYLTDLILRDAHQSLLATRFRLDDMLPIADKLDQVGFWSLESWGGATFDSCIRYLGEDPWDRIRAFKRAMPNTPQQMLLRGQNLLGYRHYADDVVERFVERAKTNGVDVFRIFDALNDVRNLRTAVKAVIANEGHAQGTLAYTVSPVHTVQMWVDMARALEDLGCHSLCIKDMAGLLRPYECETLIKALREAVDLPIAMQCHATTGLSTATYQKAIDAGIDMLDTAISSMSMTYGHTATETVVAMVENTPRDTGLNLELLAEIASYFRQVREKYAQFEGSLKGVDARILLAQVPGGMLTNMENQLKEQHALDKFDAVLKEIPEVRKDLGYIPLVTPTSQIVGTQAVLNILAEDRYKSVAKETAALLRGEYGQTPAAVDPELQKRVLAGSEPITCRPADNLDAELDKLTNELDAHASDLGLSLSKDKIDDVLIYALFPQVGLKFLQNRGNADAFESAPDAGAKIDAERESAKSSIAQSAQIERYDVNVDGQLFAVQIGPDGSLAARRGQPQGEPASGSVPAVTESSARQSESLEPESAPSTDEMVVTAPLTGTLWKHKVNVGDEVNEGDVLVVIEAMKMETDIRAEHAGRVTRLIADEGASVQVGDRLIALQAQGA